MWTHTTLNMSSFLSWASRSILNLSWKLRNFTRIGLGPALQSCRCTVGERWADSVISGVGKFSLPRRSGISWFMKPRMSQPSACSGTCKKQRLEDRLTFLPSSTFSFRLEFFFYSVLTWFPKLDMLSSLALTVFKLQNLLSKCRQRSMYCI